MNKHMNGLEYEKYCFDWLKAQGYHHVQLTKASGDQGIDILAYKNRKKYGFQCKYYQTPVGNEAVQQAYSGCAYYHCDQGCVITNNTFTKSAIALAEETDILLFENIEPVSIHFIPAFYRILSSILIGMSIFFLYGSQLTDMQILTAIALFLSGIFGLFYSHFSTCLLSAFFSLIAICLNLSVFPMMLFLSFFFLLQMIHLIVLKKQRNLFLQKTIKNELEEEIQNNTFEIGKHLEVLLSDEFHCNVQLEKAEHISQEILEFTFHVQKNVKDDIPLVEYSLNQYAKYEGMEDRYELLSVDHRTFLLRLKKCSSH